jgi:hypothetical protein
VDAVEQRLVAGGANEGADTLLGVAPCLLQRARGRRRPAAVFSIPVCFWRGERRRRRWLSRWAPRIRRSIRKCGTSRCDGSSCPPHEFHSIESLLLGLAGPDIPYRSIEFADAKHHESKCTHLPGNRASWNPIFNAN